MIVWDLKIQILFKGLLALFVFPLFGLSRAENCLSLMGAALSGRSVSRSNIKVGPEFT